MRSLTFCETQTWNPIFPIMFCVKHVPYVVLWILLEGFVGHVFVFVEMFIAEDARMNSSFRKNHKNPAQESLSAQ